MRCERMTAGGDAAASAATLRDLIPSPESVRETVAEIIAEVRAHGDRALIDYTRRFDTGGGDPAPLVVGRDDLEAASAGLAPEIRHALERAIENLEAAFAASSPTPEASVDLGASRIVQRRVPVSRAALYAPGGRAPYPSTVVMGVVPARLAGVEHIAVCSPPGHDGELDPVILGACRLTGASAVYRMGGAHAIAALAYGTESVPAVDVIVGPGNLYVQEAKRQVFGQVGIDGFAGPSDLLVIAAGDAEPHTLALDLLAQAEHGHGTLVVAASDSPELLDGLRGHLSDAAETGATAAVVDTPGAGEALKLAEAFAPEHLELVGLQAEKLAAKVT